MSHSPVRLHGPSVTAPLFIPLSRPTDDLRMTYGFIDDLDSCQPLSTVVSTLRLPYNSVQSTATGSGLQTTLLFPAGSTPDTFTTVHRAAIELRLLS